MYPPPAGTELTVDQVRELDDTFLSSDPFQYFRIASLMAWQETAPVGDRPLSEAARAVSDRTSTPIYNVRRSMVRKELDVHGQVAAAARPGLWIGCLEVGGLGRVVTRDEGADRALLLVRASSPECPVNGGL
jgi:hypothetical protein